MEIKQLNSSSANVKAVFQEIDELMDSLYPPETNVLLPLSDIDKPNVYFIGIEENSSSTQGMASEQAIGKASHKESHKENDKAIERGDTQLSCSEIIACGALVIYREPSLIEGEEENVFAELKRIYVNPKRRGKKLSIGILDALIQYAKEKRIETVRLQTGDKQGAAVELYRRYGFRFRGVYGEYEQDYVDPSAIYMEMKLRLDPELN